MKEKLGIGIGSDDFKDIIVDNLYYIDKSLFIKDVIDNNSKVSLITRPRRFGKNLNMSMLNYYFNIDMDTKDLFKGLKIMKEDKKYTSMLNSKPVIFVTFKGFKSHTYEEFLKDFRDLIKNIQ